MNKEQFISIVFPYTMTSIERINELYNSLEYIRLNNIEGDIIECGVWKGGNILGIIEYLEYYNLHSKKVWLFDTFSGMTSPENVDVDVNDIPAISQMDISVVFAYSSLEEVKNNLQPSQFPKENIIFIEGDVSKTLQDRNNIPEKISLLRLDTDWYQSTKDELEILYPKLSNKGVLIVDDYGHWKGAKKAVDEYFKNMDITISQIDYTGIKIIKNEL
jgi:hypothetical protein